MPTEISTRNKAALMGYYNAAQRGDIATVTAFFNPDFEMHAPDYLPYGGAHRGADHFVSEVLPLVASVLDFSRYESIQLIGEDEDVVSVVKLGVTGTDSTIIIVEHWKIRNDKAVSLWASYYEPKALMEQLKRVKG